METGELITLGQEHQYNIPLRALGLSFPPLPKLPRGDQEGAIQQPTQLWGHSPGLFVCVGLTLGFSSTSPKLELSRTIS